MTDDAAKIIAKLEMLEEKLGQLTNDVQSLRRELPQLRGDLTLVLARQNSTIQSNKKKSTASPVALADFITA
ncbi:MAG: hypothetical protein KDK05_15165 [Candidatus Competibacteraceae bacterium]|nr:hypothetical protein [Candidatus Competibacteraceae bacterium]